MHRMKIGLAAAVVMLAVTLGIFVTVKGNLEKAAVAEVEGRAERSEKLFQQLSRLEGIDFANLASARARKPSVVAISEQTDETERRKAAYTECEALNAILEKDGRKADIVAVLDSTGKVLARDLNPNAMYGENLRAQFPAVERALRGEATKDIWTLQGRMTQVAIAPVAKPDSTIVGALLIGNVISGKQARARAELLGTDIAYFHAGKVQTSSFVSEGEGDAAKEDGNKAVSIGQKLFQETKLVDEALSTGKAAKQILTLDGQEYITVVSAIPGNVADKTSGVVLFASLSGAKAQLVSNANMILYLGVIGILVALGASILTAKRFINPLDSIELGVADVINGNIDYSFKPVGPDFEGLSNSLNVMLARFLGRDDPSEDAVEEDDGEKKWKAEQLVIDESDGVAPASVNVQALAQENEAAYYPRLYNEYTQALRAGGKPADGVSVQAFTMKLRLAEAGLKQKWSCRGVRFAIVGQGDSLAFKAIKLS